MYKRKCRILDLELPIVLHLAFQQSPNSSYKEPRAAWVKLAGSDMTSACLL